MNNPRIFISYAWESEDVKKWVQELAIAYGNQVILNGTTIEEVEKYHKDTLRLVVEVANKQLEQINIRKQHKKLKG